MQGVLEGVHFIRVPTQIQMIATLQTLDAWLEVHPQVGVKESVFQHPGQACCDRYSKLSFSSTDTGLRAEEAHYGSVR